MSTYTKETERTRVLREILFSPITMALMLDEKRKQEKGATGFVMTMDGELPYEGDERASNISAKLPPRPSEIATANLKKELERAEGGSSDVMRVAKSYHPEVSSILRHAHSRTQMLTKRLLGEERNITSPYENERPWSKNTAINMVDKEKMKDARSKNEVLNTLERRASERFLDRAVGYTELQNLMDIIQGSKSLRDLHCHIERSPPLHPALPELHDGMQECVGKNCMRDFLRSDKFTRLCEGRKPENEVVRKRKGAFDVNTAIMRMEYTLSQG